MKPRVWAVYRYENVYRSQDNLEYSLLHVFRTMVPPSMHVTILADPWRLMTDEDRFPAALLAKVFGHR